MRALVCAVIALLLCQSAAWAQASNPVAEHYRAYRAALDAGDLAVAEREATAALAASETRNGDNAPTPALALNLAQVRLDLGRGADAVAPAQRALGLAQAQGAGSQVDTTLAQLLLGRAQLAAGESGAAARLRVALDLAAPQPAYGLSAFDAARDLALALQSQNARQALEVWDIALRIAVARDSPLLRAQALLGRGDALFDVERFDHARQVVGFVPLRTDDSSWNTFQEARALLEPHVRASPHDGRTTNAQLLYARALAQLSVVRAVRESIDENIGPVTSLLIDNMPDDGLPACVFRMRTEPMPTYPSGSLLRAGVGGAGIRLRTDEAGRLVEAVALASVGGARFTDAVNAVAPQWSAVLDPGNPPCSRSVVMYTPVIFMFR